jgi:hypothetical protein
VADVSAPVQVPVVPIYAGDSVAFPVYTVKTAEGAAIDLVADGWSDWRAQWRPQADAQDSIELTVDASRANEGMILIRVAAEDTANMGGAGVWDLQATRAGLVRTWLRGKTKWTRDVTRG